MNFYKCVLDMELLKLLDFSSFKGDVEKQFDRLAIRLMNQCVICKEEGRVVIRNKREAESNPSYYRVVECEFYLYNNSHKDPFTYPRDSDIGEWFFHYSGVDIAFETLVTDGHLLQCGGILIRSVEKYSDGQWVELYCGPLVVVGELFNPEKQYFVNRPMEGKKEVSSQIIKTKRFGLSCQENDKNGTVFCNKQYRYYVERTSWNAFHSVWKFNTERNEFTISNKIRYYSAQPKHEDDKTVLDCNGLT